MHETEILPQTGFVRLATVLRIIPVSRSSWWQGVKSGKYPTPIKISANTTAWKAEDIRDLISELSGSPTILKRGKG